MTEITTRWWRRRCRSSSSRAVARNPGPLQLLALVKDGERWQAGIGQGVLPVACSSMLYVAGGTLGITLITRGQRRAGWVHLRLPAHARSGGENRGVEHGGETGKPGYEKRLCLVAGLLHVHAAHGVDAFLAHLLVGTINYVVCCVLIAGIASAVAASER